VAPALRPWLVSLQRGHDCEAGTYDRRLTLAFSGQGTAYHVLGKVTVTVEISPLRSKPPPVAPRSPAFRPLVRPARRPPHVARRSRARALPRWL